MADSIVLLPLDSRPISIRLPAALCRMAGWTISSPPLRMLGHLSRPADFEDIRTWFFDTLTPNHSCLFVSADLICYGGLIFSREHRVSQEIALKRLDILRHIKKKYPDLSIFATGVILRDSISVRNHDDFALWEQLQSGRGPYPDWFKDIRKRNAAVNQSLLELAGEGVVDFALLGKEDTAPSNPFKKEISDLRRYIREESLSRCAAVINGTDELMALLISRRHAEQNNTKPRILVDALGSEFPKTTPLYESQPLEKTIQQQIRVAGGRMAGEGKPYDIRLLLHCPKQEQEDLFAIQLQKRRGIQKSARGKAYYRNFVDAIKKEKQMVSIADLAFANGSDYPLSDALLSAKIFFKLLSWAAWNTAANTTGTVVATSIISSVVFKLKGYCSDESFINFHITNLLERFFDDDIYQSRIRKDLVKYADNPHHLNDVHQIQKELNRLVNKIWMERLSKRALNTTFDTAFSDSCSFFISSVEPGRAKLPWGRLFECEISPNAHINLFQIEKKGK